MALKLFGKNKVHIDLLHINEQDVQNIAKSLINTYVLVVDDKEYRLAEIEFYIKSSNHNDQYTHGDLNQKKFARWYFHRYPNGSYKGGTYKGLDLTLGNDSTCFGILLRSIYCTDSEELIEGPCRIVNKILELNNVKDVAEFMKNKKDPLNARNTKNFHIKYRTQLAQEQIYKGPRVGLSDKYPEWKDINYRFLIKKNMIKKNKSNITEL